jgi:cell filamentation protein, protein adenylyltransferase
MTSTPLPPGQWVPAPDIPDIPEALRREGAYLPHPLPAHLTLPTATYRRAAHVEHTLGRLDEAAQRLGVRAGLVRSTQVRDAQSSASLAGVRVGVLHALAEDLVASHDQQPSQPDQPAGPVAPYLRAYDHGIDRLRKGAALDATVVGEMSAIMTGRAGDPPSDLVRTGPGWLGSTPARAYLLTATDAHLVGLLEQWSTWVRDETDQPRIVRMAIAHYQLEVLQPFPTANGHIARAFSTLEMIDSGLLRDQILPLSAWLDDNLDEYQRQVRAVVDTGQIHRWVDFFATAIDRQAKAQLRLIDELAALATELAAQIPQTGTMPKVVAELIGFPMINHRVLRQRYGVSMKSATDITRRLIELGILTSWESRRYRQVFMCQPVLDLLSLDPNTTVGT